MTDGRKISVFASALMMFGLFFASDVFAQDAQADYQGIIEEFERQAMMWQGVLTSSARWLFFTLATFQFVWINMALALKGGDISEFISQNVKFTLGTGIMFVFLMHSYDWMTALIMGFRQVGERAVQVSAPGADGSIDPANVFQNGLVIAGSLFEQMGVWSGVGNIALVICALVIFVCFAYLAALLAVTIVESYLVTGGAVLLFGFGGASWTSDIARKTMMYAVSVGAKLFVMQLIVGVSMGSVLSWAQAYESTSSTNTLSLIGLIIMITIMAKMIPELVQGIIAGVSVGGSGAMISTAGAGVAAGAAGVAAGAAVAGAVATGGASIAPTAAAGAVGAGAAGAAGMGGAGAGAAGATTGAQGAAAFSATGAGGGILGGSSAGAGGGAAGGGAAGGALGPLSSMGHASTSTAGSGAAGAAGPGTSGGGANPVGGGKSDGFNPSAAGVSGSSGSGSESGTATGGGSQGDSSSSSSGPSSGDTSASAAEMPIGQSAPMTESNEEPGGQLSDGSKSASGSLESADQTVVPSPTGGETSSLDDRASASSAGGHLAKMGGHIVDMGSGYNPVSGMAPIAELAGGGEVEEEAPAPMSVSDSGTGVPGGTITGAGADAGSSASTHAQRGAIAGFAVAGPGAALSPKIDAVGAKAQAALKAAKARFGIERDT